MTRFHCLPLACDLTIATCSYRHRRASGAVVAAEYVSCRGCEQGRANEVLVPAATIVRREVGAGEWARTVGVMRQRAAK